VVGFCGARRGVFMKWVAFRVFYCGLVKIWVDF